MEENKRLIEAVVIKTGEKVRVRQAEAGSEYFVTEDNSPYKSEELDFTQRDELFEWLMTPKDDTFKDSYEFLEKIEELKHNHVKGEEKGFWRNLRGQVFTELLKKATSYEPSSLTLTDSIIETLYSQDVKFNEQRKKQGD